MAEKQNQSIFGLITPVKNCEKNAKRKKNENKVLK